MNLVPFNSRTSNTVVLCEVTDSNSNDQHTDANCLAVLSKL